VLKIENLHATVAGKPILHGLTLAIPDGEIHAIMGPNGAGKSTLAYVLGGRPGYEVTQGSVTFDGQDLFALEPHERAAAGGQRSVTSCGCERPAASPPVGIR
jgi:Fe-S cluster assembly ATP-binding protein